MGAKSKSSKQWLERHHRDAYVHRARAEGQRSRAVYKLEQIQQKDRVLEAGQWVLDLGAAPGGWSEYASRVVGPRGRVIAVDILPMDAIAGVEFLQGDFTEQQTLDALLALVGDRSVDLVLSDMAPNLSGVPSVDQPKSVYLVELALDLAVQRLKPAGGFVAKLFQGEGFDRLVAQLREKFATVKLRKPAASSARSSEIYAVCSGLRQAE